MRVGTASLYQGMQQRLQRLTAGLKDLNEKIATAKKLNRLSDDPIALKDALQLKTAMGQIDQYNRNLKTAASWFNLSEAALSQTFDLVERAREIAVMMANETQSADTRATAAAEVGHLLDQAISLGNTRLNGNYIFAGFETGTVPFTKITAGGIETAQYNGDTNNFQIQIGKGETLTAGKNGRAALLNSTVFTALGTLKRALEDNDRAAIQAQLDSLTTAENYLNNQIADVGAKQNRVQMKENLLGNLKNDLQERLSEVEDSDIAEVVIQLQSKQMTYQAALAAAARINEMTLLNYMR